jgi:hypothetical protein
MSRHRILIVSGLLLLGLASPLVNAGDSPPPPSDKKAAATLKKFAAGCIKFHNSAMKDILHTFCDNLDELQDLLKAGEWPLEEIAPAVLIELDVALRGMADTTNKSVLDVIETEAQNILGYLENDGTFPKGFLEGDCNALDKAQDKINKQFSKAVGKAKKKLKAFAKKTKKAEGVEVIADVEVPEPTTISPNPNEPTPPKKKDLKVDSKASSSIGNLCVGGEYSGEPGVSVDVTITVGGQPFTVLAEVEDCRFKACFSDGDGLDAPLPEGNYTIEVREFTVDGTVQSTETSFGVPGT